MASHRNAAPARPAPIDPLARIDRAVTNDGRDALLLVARVALAAIFVQSGLGKLMDLDGFTAGMTARGLPAAALLAPLGALVEFLGGVALVVGAWARPAALLVAAFTVAATLIAHRFWAYPPAEQAAQATQLMKNASILGGLLALAVAGAGRFSVDGAVRGRS